MEKSAAVPELTLNPTCTSVGSTGGSYEINTDGSCPFFHADVCDTSGKLSIEKEISSLIIINAPSFYAFFVCCLSCRTRVPCFVQAWIRWPFWRTSCVNAAAPHTLAPPAQEPRQLVLPCRQHPSRAELSSWRESQARRLPWASCSALDGHYRPRLLRGLEPVRTEVSADVGFRFGLCD